ncbi:MAG: DUF4249 domain-containing protein [Bacteroidales bacterium]|nr:DUF4249 domain-containing protein [Bacteroidales bacterium]
MKIRKLLNILILVLVSFSCIDEYPLDIKSYEDLLVVDGMITNLPGPYTVKLSRSTSVEHPQFDPVQQAVVRIADDLGNSEQLLETEKGIYQTSAGGMQGVAGRNYKLNIQLKSGKQYETAFEKLQPAVGIDSVYAEIESKETNDPDDDLFGYQFYLNSAQPQHDTVYYLWQLTETYEFNSDFTLDYLYNGSIEPSGDPYKFYKCWKTEDIHQIFCFSTLNQNNSAVQDYPLNFVSTKSKRLTIRYSLLTTQLSVNADAYKFWDDVQDQINDEELLFDQQPFQIRGNLYNAEDPSEPVMGYFTVAGAAQKRIFVNRPLFVDFDYPLCFADTDLRTLYYTPRRYWPIYLTDTKDGIAHAAKSCFDCRMHGGVLNKPEFWIDGE